MEKYCYLNGKILETKNAKVSIADIGILRGFGVFDYLRTYNGKPFLFEEHVDRFEKSAILSGLRVPISRTEIKNIIASLLKKNNVKDAGIRMALTGGESDDGLDWNAKTPTFFILIQALHAYDMKMYEKGASLITSEFQRENPGAKTNNYLTRIKLSPKLLKKKAQEVLYIKDGIVLEGATCNIFAFVGNSLITPKDDILLGTRRALVIGLAKKYFKVRERQLTKKELENADEAFITSTTRDIMPVTKIDDKKIGSGQVGDNTKKLMELYQAYIQYQLQKYK